MRLALLLAAALALAGCAAEKEPMAEAVPEKPPAAEAGTSPAGGGDGGPTPVSPALGGASPVVGGQTLQGGGGSSAVGQIAKDRARSFASEASTSNAMAEAEGE